MTSIHAVSTSPALRFTAVARTHAGCVRAVNEDRVLDNSEAGLWAVADGMGGLHAGELAASRVVDAMAGAAGGRSGYSRLAGLLRRLELLNGEIFQESQSGPSSGSTVVALLAHDGHYACFWAGDSRAYRLRGGVLSRLSRDHSFVQELVDVGGLTESERRDHPAGNIITRAVGARDALEIEQRFGEIEDRDIFLLCSDGLTVCIDDDRLADCLQHEDLEGIGDRLLEIALQRGAPDNVSFIIIRADA